MPESTPRRKRGRPTRTGLDRALQRHLLAQDPWDQRLGSWAQAVADLGAWAEDFSSAGIRFHTEVLARLGRVAQHRSPTFALIRHRIIRRGRPGGLGLWSVIERLKRLTIDWPMAETPDTRHEVSEWLEGSFVPRWVAWCVAPVEPPGERLFLGRVLYEYAAILYPELRRREDDALESLLKELRAHPPEGALATEVRYDAGSPKDEETSEEHRALRVALREQGLVAADHDFSRPPEPHVLAEFQLPPNWNLRADTPHEIALAVLAKRYDVDATKVKEWLAAARTWGVWRWHSGWLAENPPALRELATLLGIQIIAPEADD